MTRLILLSLLLLVACGPVEPEQDWTDTGVQCLDDCLEPLDPDEKRIDAEPIRHDHEEA